MQFLKINLKEKYLFLLLSVLSGLLLSISWTKNGFPFFLFFAFVPLLIIENKIYEKQKHSSAIIPYSLITFSIWNLLTTYWIYYSAAIGLISAVIINTLFMTLCFWLFHFTHKVIGKGNSHFIGLIAYLLTFEFIHFRWDLNFPWLNLGNGFASYPEWIQWYEFTGVFGGSFWILCINILIFILIKDYYSNSYNNKTQIINFAFLALLIIVPSIYSFIRYYNYSEKENPVNVVVVQPNLDPYTEQYNINPLEITANMLRLAESKGDKNVDLIAFPESSIQEYCNEDELENSPSLMQIKQFLSKYPSAGVLAGISTNKFYLSKETSTARKLTNSDGYYDAFNTAILINQKGDFSIHHKSKLTPGVEIMPFSKYLTFIEKFALDLGGTVGSLGNDKVQKPLVLNENLKVAPIICYESVFGEFCSEFTRNGANIFCVITNDGWWGNTAGHRQHLTFSTLRAIENRRSVARSANTGISCFVNQRGDIIKPTKYWVEDAAYCKLNTNDKITFYAVFGDYIGRIAVLVAVLMLLRTFSLNIISKKKRIVN